MALWKDSTLTPNSTPAAPDPAARAPVAPTANTPPPVPASSVPPVPAAKERPSMKESVISAGLSIEGKIVGSGHVRVAGKFKGDVQVDGNPRINAVSDEFLKLFERPVLVYRGRRVLDVPARQLASITVQRGGVDRVLPVVALAREIHLAVGGLRFGVAVGEQDSELGLAGPLRLRRGRREHGDAQEYLAEDVLHGELPG